MKFGLKLEDIAKINKRLGGTLRDAASLDFALHAGEGKRDIRRLALIWRAILTDHPFDDGNKRTAELVTRKYARSKGLRVDTPRLVREILDVSRGNITNLDKIERRIKYATTGN